MIWLIRPVAPAILALVAPEAAAGAGAFFGAAAFAGAAFAAGAAALGAAVFFGAVAMSSFLVFNRKI
jgi:hypothetical protein